MPRDYRVLWGYKASEDFKEYKEVQERRGYQAHKDPKEQEELLVYQDHLGSQAHKAKRGLWALLAHKVYPDRKEKGLWALLALLGHLVQKALGVHLHP